LSHTIIIGGGITGLTAASYLHKAGHTFTVLEASDQVGGRIRSDHVNGYILDRGFQVLLTAYPEAQQLLDYDKLALQQFSPGALLLQDGGKTSRIGDPKRDFSSLWPTLKANIGSLKDKRKILKLTKSLAKHSVDDLFERHEISAYKALREVYGFSEKMVTEFFEPFYSGIFLERDLKASRRMFDFVFKCFAEGHAAIPKKGMGAIPDQLASKLPEDSIKLNTKVTGINGHFVNATGGDVYRGDNIIIATEATGFVNEIEDLSVPQDYVSTTHIHVTADQAPIEQPLIGLLTQKDRLVNNICSISKVAPSYKGENDRELLSISIVGKSDKGNEALFSAIQQELKPWFGDAVNDWEHLHSHTVEYALPQQHAVQRAEVQRINYYTLIAGDHSSNGSINEAMRSGRLAAEAICGSKV